MADATTQAAAEPAPAADARPAAKARGEDTLIRVIDQWPAHPGWKRWLFRVWDKRTRNYISEAFPDGEKAKGWEWAEHERALLNQGKTGAGPVLFEAVGRRYVDDLRKAGKTEAHIAEVERLYQAAVAAGATNLRSPEFAASVRDWLAAAPSFTKVDEGPIRRAREYLVRSQARLALAETFAGRPSGIDHANAAARLAKARERLAAAERFAATGPARYAAKAAKRLAKARARLDAAERYTPPKARHNAAAAARRVAKAQARVKHDGQRLALAEERIAALRRTPSAITRNRWLVILKSIARSARRFGVADNPLTEIKPFKQGKPVKTVLRVDELRAIVHDDRAADEYFRVASLLVYGGLRVDEAAHACWEWIDLEGRTITIPDEMRYQDSRGRARVWAPKGNKGRIAPILDELAELLAGWRAAGAARAARTRPAWVTPDEAIRESEGKGHWLRFREYLGRCGIDAEARDLSPHCTRHTWTAIRLATGVSPNRLRLELGHEKLETTDIYASAEQLYDKAVKDWPRGEICLRRQPAARAAAAGGFLLDCDRDPREVLDLFLARGGKLDHLAAAAGVPAAVLRTWMIDGIPDAVRQYLAVMAASARLAAAAAAPAPKPLVAAVAALAAPSTAGTESR